MQQWYSVVYEATMDNMIPLIVVTNDELLPEKQSPGQQANVAVQLQNIANIRRSVSYGDRIILGAGGLGKKLLLKVLATYWVCWEGREGDIILLCCNTIFSAV